MKKEKEDKKSEEIIIRISSTRKIPASAIKCLKKIIEKAGIKAKYGHWY